MCLRCSRRIRLLCWFLCPVDVFNNPMMCRRYVPFLSGVLWVFCYDILDISSISSVFNFLLDIFDWNGVGSPTMGSFTYILAISGFLYRVGSPIRWTMTYNSAIISLTIKNDQWYEHEPTYLYSYTHVAY